MRWAGTGARRAPDIEFCTNEEPPFLNKAITNHAPPMVVDGEPATQWIAAAVQRRTDHAELRAVP